MSYRQSRARRSFEVQLEDAVQELTPLYKISQKAGGGARLLAAYYVFAFAQLEVYVRSIVEDSLAAVESTSPPFDRWPDLMLAYLLHRSSDLAADYRKFGIGEDEHANLSKVAGLAREVAQWGNGGPRPVALDPAVFLEKKKYPSPRNLPQLFRRLGVQQIWPIVSAAGKMNSELILTSLNDLRTGIAHEGKVPPGFSLADFRDRIGQMKRFAAALDRALAKHFCSSVIARAQWNASVA